MSYRLGRAIEFMHVGAARWSGCSEAFQATSEIGGVHGWMRGDLHWLTLLYTGMTYGAFTLWHFNSISTTIVATLRDHNAIY